MDNEHRLIAEAQQSLGAPAERLRWLEPLVPPQYGYGDSASRQPTIGDALGLSRFYPDRRVDFSGIGGGNMPAGAVGPTFG